LADTVKGRAKEVFGFGTHHPPRTSARAHPKELASASTPLAAIHILPVGKGGASATAVTSQRVERRLAAILAGDVANYSRLMGLDEVGTLETLKAHRREVVDPAIAEHKGRIVKTTGDGMLVEFASTVDAVTCAVAIQEKMAERSASGPEPRIRFRIGINVGEIIIDGDDIFGDGVNVAARVENECEPGGVCVSGNAFEQIRGKTKFTFDDLGDRTLKNIGRPVRLYGVRGASALALATAAALSSIGPNASDPLPPPDRPSIAVLPFSNISGDPEQEYFADGMVEEIITALSRIRGLFVIARNSSFTYKGRAVDVKQVGRELGVRYVLEGSIRKGGNRMRITGQLIDAETGMHLWADNFDGAIDDIFALQDQVAESIVGVLTPNLERAEIDRVRRKPTANMDAYDCYLRAVAVARMWSRAGIDESLSLCMRAIALDPNFAPAYGQAARCYSLRKSNGWIVDLRKDMAEAERMARGAWAADRDDATAVGPAAHALASVVMDLNGGAAYIERALASNPNYAPGWRFSGWINLWLGRGDLAVEHAARAMRLSPRDPESDSMRATIAHAHYFAGKYDEALSWANLALQERPNAHQALRIGAASAAMAGRGVEATALRLKLMQADPRLRASTLGDLLGPYRDPEHPARYAEGLRRAGLPE
jgi:TolB-like protein/class 3 adenylate cyclase